MVGSCQYAYVPERYSPNCNIDTRNGAVEFNSEKRSPSAPYRWVIPPFTVNSINLCRLSSSNLYSVGGIPTSANASIAPSSRLPETAAYQRGGTVPGGATILPTFFGCSVLGAIFVISVKGQRGPEPAETAPGSTMCSSK